MPAWLAQNIGTGKQDCCHLSLAQLDWDELTACSPAESLSEREEVRRRHPEAAATTLTALSLPQGLSHSQPRISAHSAAFCCLQPSARPPTLRSAL
ncbi:hypothetical protein AOLI_G00294210 [Acnodon oligacanthus]